MTRVLWVTYETPDRGHGGGAIRQAHLLDALARRSETHLLVAGQLRDQGLRALLAGITELGMDRAIHAPIVSPLRRRTRSLVHTLFGRQPLDFEADAPWRTGLGPALAELKDGFDIVHLEHPGLASLINRDGPAKWAVTLQNLASRRVEQQLAITSGSRQRWLFRREIEKARRLESWVGRSFDAVYVSSPEDAAMMPGPVEVVPNGVDIGQLVPTPLPSEPRVLLSGSLYYLPNVDGARWFANQVWPLVLRQVPAARLDIAGRAPVAEVLALSERPGISVHPDVPEMGRYLEAARLAVVPVRIGSGTRLKALEALSAGRPVVGTTVGLEGIGIVDGIQAQVTDSPESMARAIVELLGDDDRSRRIGAAGRQLVEERFSWRVVGEDFADKILSLASREP